MARDRLAAIRIQQGHGDTPSNTSQSDGRYQSRPDTYTQGDRYEMAGVSPNSEITGDAMSTFYSEISSIQDSLKMFSDNVSRISDLHSRSLNNMDEEAAQRNVAQLDGLVQETSSLSNELKVRIKNLQKRDGNGRDGRICKQQTGLVKQKFVEAIQNYQQVEQQYREKYKQRMERQFKIVKPDATPEEVKAVVNGDQPEQIFAQAIQSSNRYGESRAAYREAQVRHEDIKRIERTLGELAQLFNDMSVLVEQQDETIDVVMTSAVNVEQDAEAGLQHTRRAVLSAWAARRKRWICFVISLIILAVIGIVVGVVVAENTKNKTKSG